MKLNPSGVNSCEFSKGNEKGLQFSTERETRCIVAVTRFSWSKVRLYLELIIFLFVRDYISHLELGLVSVNYRLLVIPARVWLEKKQTTDIETWMQRLQLRYNVMLLKLKVCINLICVFNQIRWTRNQKAFSIKLSRNPTPPPTPLLHCSIAPFLSGFRSRL